MARPRIRQSKRAQIDVLVGCVETLAFDAEAADARDSAHEIDVDRSSESVPRPSARLTAATSANSLRFASVAGQPGTRSSNSICAMDLGRFAAAAKPPAFDQHLSTVTGVRRTAQAKLRKTNRPAPADRLS